MSDSDLPPIDALTRATQMVKNGRLDQARETLMQYLMTNPSSEQAWLLMSFVLSDPAKQKDCLERVLKINPNNTVAQSKLAHLLGRRTEELFKKKAESPKPSPEKPEPEPEALPDREAAPVSKPKLPRFNLKPILAKKPVQDQEAHDAEPPGPSTPPEGVPPATSRSIFSEKWVRIATIVLVALVLIVTAVILYVGVIGPAVNALSATPIPTNTPVTVVFPQQWTQTLTPTITPPPPPTETPEAPLSPSETTIS